ncbi:hypothetical protein [Dehalobacter sp. TeCB1]|uniref:hypothetical protein n=1 Tax=Dehalobacter sp. TeCB1 TaxID=1843715 RepID=UPI00083B56F9|nr:hypothetical protein [Dehalobacter sp. TeCB1]OCZ54308.1 hypothetical protein A7D23_05940 [Dehalobacter sp. TeCB1]
MGRNFDVGFVRPLSDKKGGNLFDFEKGTYVVNYQGYAPAVGSESLVYSVTGKGILYCIGAFGAGSDTRWRFVIDGVQYKSLDSTKILFNGLVRFNSSFQVYAQNPTSTYSLDLGWTLLLD